MLLTTALSAQNAVLQGFSAQQKDAGVLITWVIGKGSQCPDVEVQHSTDSINFTSVYTYPGICGSNSDAASYTWMHSSPLPDQKNYYRIYIPTSGYSNVVAIHHHSFDNSGYIAAPNPSNGKVTVYFKNPQSKPHSLLLFDIHGKLVDRIIDVTTSEIVIDGSQLRSGTYFFRLSENNSSAITGKIVIY